MTHPMRTFFWCILLTCMPQQLLPVSMVYNFRIAQITKQPIFQKPDHRHHTVIALPFEQFRKKRDGVKQNFAGGLASYIFDFSDYYLRTDVAFSHIHEWSDHETTFSGTETDDILFTLGKNFAVGKRSSLTFSGLFGVPTHRIYRLQHTDFGYSQVGLGLQLDGLTECNRVSSVVYGARYLYFVPRTALDPACDKHKFTLGNVADLLVASKNSWEYHGFEVGYTARFRFGAHCCPPFDEIVEKTNYIRSNFYAVYKYKWKIRDVANRFLVNFGYGFDHTPRRLGNKYILTLWLSWNINF